MHTKNLVTWVVICYDKPNLYFASVTDRYIIGRVVIFVCRILPPVIKIIDDLPSVMDRQRKSTFKSDKLIAMVSVPQNERQPLYVNSEASVGC